MSLSVVIPVYNEEDIIEETIAEVHKVLSESNISEFEIVVVDDGSKDNTAQILKQSRYASLFQLVIHERNIGYGAALKSGIRRAKYEYIAITDADGTYPIKDIPKLYSYMPDYDMVVGARTGEKVNIPFVRKPAKWFLHKLANYLTASYIPDLNSGLRIFRKKDAVRLFGILPRGFSFTTTITLAMLTNDMHVKFIPINYLKRTGKSKIKPIRDTILFIQLIIRTVLYFNPLKVFLPLSLLFFFLSAGVLFYTAFFTPRILDATVSILFLAGLQTLSIGMIADIIDKKSKL